MQFTFSERKLKTAKPNVFQHQKHPDIDRSDTMSPINEKAINNATASIEMEGFAILSEYKKLCEKLLNKEITMTEYIAAVKAIQEID